MAELLKSARRKVARAKQHISELQTSTDEFLSRKPSTVVVEPDPNNPRYEIYKLRFEEGIPESFENSTSDALHNLRDSLDNAGYALAVASGKINPQYAAFPFAGSAAQFENSLGRAKDIPKAFQDVFRAYHPYKGAMMSFGLSATWLSPTSISYSCLLSTLSWEMSPGKEAFIASL